MRLRILLCGVITSLLLCLGMPGQGVDEAPKKPVLLFSLYYHAAGDQRALPETEYKEALARLGEDFEVRVSAEPISFALLKDVKVLFISTPGDKAWGNNPPPKHVSSDDVHVISNFVQLGGGLVFFSNQTEAHNTEKKDANLLLEHFGIRATHYIVDVKDIPIPRKTPLIGGLRWRFIYGCPLEVDAGHFLKPRVLVMNDIANKPVVGTRDIAGPLIAVDEAGKGRVVVTGDGGWINNDVLTAKDDKGLPTNDNWEICRRLFRWAAGFADPQGKGK